MTDGIFKGQIYPITSCKDWTHCMKLTHYHFHQQANADSNKVTTWLFLWPNYYLVIPMTPHARRPPAFPVVLLNSWPPRPRSSSSTWTWTRPQTQSVQQFSHNHYTFSGLSLLAKGNAYTYTHAINNFNRALALLLTPSVWPVVVVCCHQQTNTCLIYKLRPLSNLPSKNFNNLSTVNH